MNESKWTIQKIGSSYSILDPSGERRARFADADIMAAHVAMIIENIDRLQSERGTLLAACRQAQPCLDPSIKGGILAIKMVRDAIALCRNNEGVAK